LILDTSASMQVDSRFADAVKIADGYVSKKNSIILASDTPLLALEGGDASSAKDIFSKVKPGAGTADLSAAITTGMRLLSKEGGGRIIVISDFTNSKGDDPVSSKNLAESYGISVNFVKVGKPANNIGIINGWIEATDGKYGYTGVIKNYKDQDEKVKIETGRGISGNSTSFSLDVPAGGTKQFTLGNIGPGTTTVQLNVKDSLPVDNKAYISIPDTSKQRILYVTDDGKLPSKTALSLLPNSNLSVAKTVPSSLDSYTLVVLAQKETPIANDSVETIENYVRNGGNAVFIASGALAPEKTEVGLIKILPVKPTEIENETNGTDLGVEEVQQSSITKDIRSDEISVHTYLNATERTGSTTLVALKNGVPILSYWQVGKGTIFYMGLGDELGDNAWNNFHNLPEYPVFWIKLVEWLGGTG
ncbi:vWA domain-containing protein, partial [Methanosarcina sp. UBA5]|uniref:vWA domain-containing protein n=1 Tax=Methanosarcina sp. UBA5 TaxID=1915593 RepID=UPI0025FA91C9